MEKLGYESPLAETTQLYQAMDTSFRGAVGMASFLAAFVENADDSRLSARTASSSLAALPGPPCPSDLESTVVDVDVGPQAFRIVEDMLDSKIASSAMRIEGSVQADVAQLRAQIADCERSAKAESQRLAERIEAKCMMRGLPQLRN
jgi:hypothetical protein